MHNIRAKLTLSLIILAWFSGVTPLKCILLLIAIIGFWFLHHQIVFKGGADEPPRVIGVLPYYGHGLDVMRDSRGFVAKYNEVFGIGEPWSYYSNGVVFTMVSSEADLKEFHSTPENVFSFQEVFRQFQIGGWPTKGTVFLARHHYYSNALNRAKVGSLAPLFHKVLTGAMSKWADSGTMPLRMCAEQLMVATSTPAIFSPGIYNSGMHERYLKLFAMVRGAGFPFRKQLWKKLMMSYIDPMPFKRHTRPLWDEVYTLLTPLVEHRIKIVKRRNELTERSDDQKDNTTVANTDSTVDAEIDKLAREDQIYSIDSIISVRLQDLAKAIQKKQEELDAQTPAGETRKLSKEQLASMEAEALDVIEIINDCYGLAHGAVDNVPGTLSWAFYHFIRDEKMRDGIMQKVNNLLQSTQKEYLELDDLDQLPELTAVFYECNRLYWAGYTFRKVMKTTKLKNGKTIKEGTFIGSQNLRMNSTHFANPEVFDINRHLGPECEAKKAGVFFPAFGYGKHRCLGQQFALLEMSNAVISLFRRFSLRLVSTAEPKLDKFQISGMLNTTPPIMVEFSRIAS